MTLTRALFEALRACLLTAVGCGIALGVAAVGYEVAGDVGSCVALGLALVLALTGFIYWMENYQ
jgi:hypothetical protein